MSWRPIETAPLNGTLVLLWLPEPVDSNDVLGWASWKATNVVLGWWDNPDWVMCWMYDGAADTEGYSSQFFTECHPTHWQPLPEAPQ